MQHRYSTIRKKIIFTLTGGLWVAGLLLAGSDSPFMPWTNILGVILFWGAGIFISGRIRRAGRHTSPPRVPKSRPMPGSTARAAAGQRRRMNIRYALEG